MIAPATARPRHQPPAQAPADPERQARLDRARAFCVEAARLCDDLNCRDVRVLDVTGLSPVCDFFLIATGASPRQMRSVVVRVAELAADYDLQPLGPVKRADADEVWTAIDLVDVVAHVFSDEARDFYDLDNLWGDARQILWTRDESA